MVYCARCPRGHNLVWRTSLGKSIIIAALIAAVWPAGAIADQCAGQVMQQNCELFLGEPRQEDICTFRDTKKVLAVCHIGDECEITGTIRECLFGRRNADQTIFCYRSDHQHRRGMFCVLSHRSRGFSRRSKPGLGGGMERHIECSSERREAIYSAQNFQWSRKT
jgi:hypothetical protein